MLFTKVSEADYCNSMKDTQQKTRVPNSAQRINIALATPAGRKANEAVSILMGTLVSGVKICDGNWLWHVFCLRFGLKCMAVWHRWCITYTTAACSEWGEKANKGVVCI